MNKKKIKRAIISVYNKSNLKLILPTLKKFNIEIISSGNSYKKIKSMRYDCTEVSNYTGSSKMLDGRVKTYKRKFVAHKTTDFRLNKYEKGGYMSLHCDNIHHSHGQQYGYPQATVLLFLNDDFKGGQFIVSELQLNIMKGDAIIFPSNFMFPHEVKEVKSGTRWSIVSWLM